MALNYNQCNKIASKSFNI